MFSLSLMKISSYSRPRYLYNEGMYLLSFKSFFVIAIYTSQCRVVNTWRAFNLVSSPHRAKSLLFFQGNLPILELLSLVQFLSTLFFCSEGNTPILQPTYLSCPNIPLLVIGILSWISQPSRNSANLGANCLSCPFMGISHLIPTFSSLSIIIIWRHFKQCQLSPLLETPAWPSSSLYNVIPLISVDHTGSLPTSILSSVMEISSLLLDWRSNLPIMPYYTNLIVDTDILLSSLYCHPRWPSSDTSSPLFINPLFDCRLLNLWILFCHLDWDFPQPLKVSHWYPSTNFSSRLSRRSRHGMPISCLGSKYTPLLISLPSMFPVILQPETLFIAAHIYINTSFRRLPPRSWFTSVRSTLAFLILFYVYIYLIFSHCYRASRLLLFSDDLPFLWPLFSAQTDALGPNLDNTRLQWGAGYFNDETDTSRIPSPS